MHMQRCTFFKDTLSEGEPFSNISPGIKRAIEEEVDKRHVELLHNVQDTIDAVVADFDSMCIVEEAPDAKRESLRSQVREFVHRAKTKLDGPMEVEFANATKDSE